MASSYPSSLDSFTNPAGTDALTSPAHAAQHANANDAIEAIESTLGTNPQGSYATVALRLGAVDLAAGSAAASAASAASSASSAAGAAVDAGAAANLAVATYDSFDDRYLGPKSSAPSVDNDGNALIAGALYWNTTLSQMFAWTGSTWQTLSSATLPQAISVSSSDAALRVTQTGSGNALVVEDSANPDATPFVVNADGQAVIGHTDNLTIVSPNIGLQVIGTGGKSSNANIARFTNDNAGSALFISKSRATTPGINTVVVSGDTLGNLIWAGADGTSYVQAAQIAAAVDGTPGTNDMPGRLVFSTTADGASSPTERMRITSAGNVGIGTSSPVNALHVVGNGIRSSTSITIGNSTGGTYQAGSIYADSNWGMLIRATNSTAQVSEISFMKNDGTELMRIAPSGLITGTGTSLGAWTAYTPTWTATTTNPAIGNGSIGGNYCQIGKTVICTGVIVAGSTTTFGSGTYFVSLPVAAKNASIVPRGRGIGYDASAGVYYNFDVDTNDAATTLTFRVQRVDATYSTLSTVTEALPVTWANTDVIRWHIVYEIA